MHILSKISLQRVKKFWQKTFTIIVVIGTLTTQQVLAQVTDDFSDGEFLSNPTWLGADSKFAIVSNQLKLQAPAVNGNAYLSTFSESINDASWEFFVRLNFNPSSTNYARVYLVSDQTDLSGPLNGYYVMIGDTPDEVSLYRQTGTTRTKIIDGANGRVNATPVIIKIKATRAASGQWELFTDIGVSGNYVAEGSTIDMTHTASAWFGVYCAYTSTRSDKFFFDDFNVNGNAFEDIIAPQCQRLSVLSSQLLELVFNETVDAVTAEDISHYLVSTGIGNPQTAELHTDGKTVWLTFSQPFTNGTEVSLTISGIKDLAGNTIITQQKSFLYFQPTPPSNKDIIVTEIFADPTPGIGLPANEFVEVYNRSQNPIDLEGWIITDGSSSGILSKNILLPGEYLILTSSAAEFTPFGKVMGIQNFPTLNNSGDIIMLIDPESKIIDSVNYSDDWYQDDDKKQGGWSLELIDPANICAEKTNWTASVDNKGGTPGKQNSVNASKPDLTGPKLLSAIPLDDVMLKLIFNERLDEAVPSTEKFLLAPTLTVTGANLGTSLHEVILKISPAMMKEQRYTITVSDLDDCAGNNIQADFNSTEFGMPENPKASDVVINEVLFNPRPTGVDFVEVYNRSNKFFNLKKWVLGNFSDSVVSNAKVITDKDLLLKPGSFLVLTTKANTLKGEYILAHEENFLEVETLPSLNDDEGSIALTNENGDVIDHFHYTDKMHSVLIKDNEGVSLERIDANTMTSNEENWRSASSSSGFATPGYRNSNQHNESTGDEAVSVKPEIFQPQSGQQDFTQIHYHFDRGGFVANINIFDPRGRKIKTLANNEILSAEGFFQWNGDSDDGAKARIGYYMVLFEIFDEKGTVKTFRKRIAIAGQL